MEILSSFYRFVGGRVLHRIGLILVVFTLAGHPAICQSSIRPSKNSFHAWRLEQQLRHGCLFSQAAAEDLPFVTDFGMAPNGVPLSDGRLGVQSGGDIMSTCSPDETLFSSLFDEVAAQIDKGIVEAGRACGSVENDDAVSVDLAIVVSNSVDSQLTGEDSYWEYYFDCDQWKVVFSDITCDASNIDSGKKIRCSMAASIAKFISIRNFVEVVRRLEFDLVENLSCCDQALQLPIDQNGLHSRFENSDEMHFVEMLLTMFRTNNYPVVGPFRHVQERLMAKFEFTRTYFADTFLPVFCDPVLIYEGLR